MRRLFAGFCAFALTASLLSSCDLLDNADDVKFTTDFDLPAPFVIDEQADEPANPYQSVSSSIAAEQDPEVQKYKDKIKEIKVNKITYTITDFSADGPVTMTSGKAIFAANGGASGVVAQATNVVLSEGATGELVVDQAGLDQISEILLNDGVVTVSSEASLSDAPVSFKVNVSLNVTVTANALD